VTFFRDVSASHITAAAAENGPEPLSNEARRAGSTSLAGGGDACEWELRPMILFERKKLCWAFSRPFQLSSVVMWRSASRISAAILLLGLLCGCASLRKNCASLTVEEKELFRRSVQHIRQDTTVQQFLADEGAELVRADRLHPSAYQIFAHDERFLSELGIPESEAIDSLIAVDRRRERGGCLKDFGRDRGEWRQNGKVALFFSKPFENYLMAIMDRQYVETVVPEPTSLLVILKFSKQGKKTRTVSSFEFDVISDNHSE